MIPARILHPTDFSPAADAALAHAAAWSRRLGAGLDVLHVVRADPTSPHDPAHYVLDFDAVCGELERRSARAIDDAIARTGAGDVVTARAVRREVSVAEAIAAYAADHGIDWIVLGTHGARGVRDLVLGSVAEELVRAGTWPVLAIPGRARAPEARGPERIVAPVDFSNGSEDAIRVARKLAGTCESTLLLLHVVEDVPWPDVYFDTGEARFLEEPAVAERCRAELVRLYQSAGGPDVDHDARVAEGRPAHDIPRFAERNRADLIVMSTHGHSGPDQVLLGSTTDRVIRRAPCPVLVLPVARARAGSLAR